MRVETITFHGDRFDIPKDELRNWTRGMKKEDVISVQINADGSITLFYWS
jgi:hypothetical protein